MRTTLSLMLLLLLWIMCRHLCSIPYRKHVQTFAFAHVFFLMFCIHWLIGNSVVFIPFATWPMDRPKKKWNEFTNNRYCWWYCCSDTMAIITLSIHSCASPQGRCLLFYSPIYAHFTYFRRSGCSTFSHCFVPLSLSLSIYISIRLSIYTSPSLALSPISISYNLMSFGSLCANQWNSFAYTMHFASMVFYNWTRIQLVWTRKALICIYARERERESGCVWFCMSSMLNLTSQTRHLYVCSCLLLVCRFVLLLYRVVSAENSTFSYWFIAYLQRILFTHNIFIYWSCCERYAVGDDLFFYISLYILNIICICQNRKLPFCVGIPFWLSNEPLLSSCIPYDIDSSGIPFDRLTQLNSSNIRGMYVL